MMMKGLALIAQVLVLTIAVHGEARSCCEDLQGGWVNELKSVAYFNCTGNGSLTGSYNSAVGKATDFYPLFGSYTVGTTGYTCIVGWTVAYNNKAHGNSRSTAAWSGIYYQAEQKIYTQWILTMDAPRKDMWSSSIINHDEFIRKKRNQ